MSGKQRLTLEKRLEIGSDCESRLDIRRMYPWLMIAIGLHKDRTSGTWKLQRRPKRPKGRRGKSVREQIVHEVAELHGETPRMVTTCWVEYRKATASFRKALQAKQPDLTYKSGKKRRHPNKHFDEQWGQGWEKKPISQLKGDGLFARIYASEFGLGPEGDWRKNKDFFRRQPEELYHFEKPIPRGRPKRRWGKRK